MELRTIKFSMKFFALSFVGFVSSFRGRESTKVNKFPVVSDLRKPCVTVRRNAFISRCVIFADSPIELILRQRAFTQIRAEIIQPVAINMIDSFPVKTKRDEAMHVERDSFSIYADISSRIKTLTLLILSYCMPVVSTVNFVTIGIDFTNEATS